MSKRTSLTAGLEAKYEKKVAVLDERQFKTCVVKQIERGLINKRYLFVHFDGKGWNILTTDDKQSKVNTGYYRLH